MGTDLNRLLERLRPGDMAPTRRGVINNIQNPAMKIARETLHDIHEALPEPTQQIMHVKVRKTLPLSGFSFIAREACLWLRKQLQV
jgi:hypothetical protein